MRFLTQIIMALNEYDEAENCLNVYNILIKTI
jgi:hypothetical protein